MPEQPSTLAARIRVKYPGVYDDIADMELEQRVGAKFPGAYDDIPRTEATLTRERPASAGPSALSAGHHPGTLAGGGPEATIFGMSKDDLPSDAAFLKRGPDVGLAVGSVLGGPLGGGVGRAAGRLVKNQYDQGAHLPNKGEAAMAVGEGAVSTALGAGARLAQVGARFGGPIVANNASGISQGVSTLSGVGTGIASGNVLTGLGAAGATRMLTNPRLVKGIGNVASRIGNSPGVESFADWTGRGLRAVQSDAFRKALLDALAEEQPASAVP